ncbi:MAG TPA: peroxiredoxin family protein [Methanocella sp.]|uniref:peroxiredoxin family protein n=1 Tax=Methanocella sp. TaxID=2052833 RepID=UPI002C0FBA1E|nr:peroxiredoxin family protein [Methanocella sp.]HTY90025.1 peroxiredoxin family protein [Methanocella sp.]
MYNMEYRIEVGEMAPDFRLKSTDGREIRLYDCKNKKTVLLFFFNHGCTERLKTLAADYGRFKDAGVAVFPVSIMKVDEGKALVQKLGLPFGILCDDDHAVVRDYKMGQCSDTPSQVCFEVIHDVEFPTMLVVDTSGIIRYKQSVGASGTPDNLTLMEQCRKAFK